MNYEKLTLERFGTNLKEGKYDTPTGARRAIGKTSSWKQAEKDQAQAMVNKHFKVDASAAAKPAAKKAAVKKTPAKKAAKKTQAKATAAEPVEKPATVKRTPSVASAAEKFKAPPASVGTLDAVQMSHQLIGVAHAARAEIDKAREADPQADFTGVEKELRLVLHRGLALVSVSTDAVEGTAVLPPPRVSVPVSTPAPKPTVTVKATPIPAPAPVVETKPAAPENGVGHELTAEEQRIADEIRSTTPTAGIAGLPRPVIPSQG